MTRLPPALCERAFLAREGAEGCRGSEKNIVVRVRRKRIATDEACQKYETARRIIKRILRKVRMHTFADEAIETGGKSMSRDPLGDLPEV